jgi:lon-related putative ATP-dependent protease
VAADFEEDMERNPDNVQAYAQLIGTLARKENLRHFDRMAVARVVEHSSRIAHDAEKLSTHMQSISDLLRESSFWAGQEDREVVSLPDVRRALQAQKYRAGRVSEKIKEAMIRETLFIDTHGSVVGQINGLAVYSQGDFAFGKASRITARVRMGKGEVVDIERQVEMGGPLHSKGVLILAGYLGSRYASERPLSLSASLVFEQSYSGVDGDSASSAELYALLSALSAIPIDQSFAVTGSVNQLGQVQAIGGVNEKVEGFFELCSERGLTGQQGVLIPAANVKHLMLAEPVLRAVEEGKFKVFAVNHVDEGIEILTGVSAGKRDEQGSFPADSLNGRIVERLETLAKKQRAYSARNGSADSNENAG